MTPIDTRRIAANIRRIRESKYYSLEYMAGKLGMGQNGYSKIELNKTRLTVAHLLSIAILLEIDAAELLAA
jgi:transcriptional regulator with XRE-family HTH domain